METVYLLEWTFSPSDYFEDSIQIINDQYQMSIGRGKVEAQVSAEFYDEEDHQMRDQLHKDLDSRFLGVQIFTHAPFELSNPTVYKINPDGSKVGFLVGESAVHKTSSKQVDIIAKDKNGTIVADTQMERIERKKHIAELAERYRGNNPIVDSILNSYQAAVMDPENELIHLYEIRDALVKEFGRKREVLRVLGVNEREWNDFGRLSNHEPVKQGRHRGEHAGGLRDATHEELQFAREFSQKLIIAYFEYLDR